MEPIALVLSIISLIIAISTFLFTYNKYYKRVLRLNRNSIEVTERLGRWNIVSDLEKEISSYHSEKWAIEIKSDLLKGEELERHELELRHVLDNQPDWSFAKDDQLENKSDKNTGAKSVRYWKIREEANENHKKTQYLSSPAIHSIMLWFRKVNRALEYKLLTEEELVDWWRQVLPLGFAGRLEYFQKYFRGSQDIRSMCKVISSMIITLDEQDHAIASDYYKYFSIADRDILKGIGGTGAKAKAVLDKNRK